MKIDFDFSDVAKDLISTECDLKYYADVKTFLFECLDEIPLEVYRLKQCPGFDYNNHEPQISDRFDIIVRITKDRVVSVDVDILFELYIDGGSSWVDDAYTIKGFEPIGVTVYDFKDIELDKVILSECVY